MRTMIDLRSGRQGAGFNVIDTPTSIECGAAAGREFRFRRSFRSLVECMVPACCAFTPTSSSSSSDDSLSTDSDSVHGGSTVTGTIFGHRRGRVSFCIQDDARSSSPPLLLLEFSVPTAYLAREMQHGLLRIALECDRRSHKDGRGWPPCPLYDVPVWCMYCNGRKVGFAVRRQVTAADAAVLKLMQSVSVGAGVLTVADDGDGGELMYLRASFDRVVGSADSESFHMVNPVGSSGQELSVFLLRS